MIVVDAHNEAASFDAEIGTAVVLPTGSTVTGNVLAFERNLDAFDLYEAVKRGSSTVTGLNAPFDVRVMPKKSENAKGYVGAAANRFEEDPDED